MTTRAGHDAKLVIAILLVTMAMGMLDAISLLHLKIFAGYMTATIILMAVNIATSQAIVLSGLEAIGFYFLGAMIGGRLVRRQRSIRATVGDILLGVGAMVGLAAWIWSANIPGDIYVTLALLSCAMGLQTSATRHAKLPDMVLPAATMVLHGLAHNSSAAGGSSAGTLRRVAAILSLFVGAAIGTLVSGWSVSVGIALAGGTIVVGGCLLLLRKHPLAFHLDRMSIP
ncbi:MAG: YoaK family protein [Acetobacter sp.]